MQPLMVTNRDRYPSTFFEKGESLSLDHNMRCSLVRRQKNNHRRISRLLAAGKTKVPGPKTRRGSAIPLL
jgi:hypothetical protein